MPANEETDPGASAEPVASSSDGNGHGSTLPPPRQAVHRLGLLIGEVREYVAYFLAAKSDSLKLSLRRLGIYAALGALGLIALCTFLAAGVVFLLWGAALGLSALFGDRLWLGCLLVGIAVLGGMALSASLTLWRMRESSRLKTVKKYEQRQDWQRDQFGRDVGEAAARRPE